MAGVTRTVDFNAGTNGATITVAGQIAAVTGAPTFSNDGLHGGMGMGVGVSAATNASTFIQISLGASAVTHSGQFYYRPKSQSASFTTIVRFADAANAALFSITQTTTKFDIRDASGTTVATSALTWADQWYRFDWQVDLSTPTAPVLTLRLYATPEAFTPTETLTPTLSTTLTFARWLFGAVGVGGASSTRANRFDTIRIADGSLEWIAPFVPAYTGSLALTGSGTLATAGTPGVSGALGLSGTGGIATGGTPAPRDVINLTGSGQFAATGVPNPAGALPLAGSGQLAATGKPAVPGFLPLSGSGLLIPAGNPAVAGRLDSVGAGALALQGAPGMKDSLHLAGTGQVAVNGNPGMTAALALGGSGALALSGAAAFPPIYPGHLTATATQSLAAGDHHSGLTATSTPTSRLEASDGV